MSAARRPAYPCVVDAEAGSTPQDRAGTARACQHPITLDTYSHVAPGLQQAAAARFDDMLQLHREAHRRGGAVPHNPPDKAIVLCADEESQIQALRRNQPGLPINMGRLGTTTHGCKRHGTTTLFAALNTQDRRVIGEGMAKHHQEFLRFPRRLDRESSKGMALHLIVDSYGTHKQPIAKPWPDKHPRTTGH